ncbi:MAG: hypothetical protein Q4D38_00400 [Planctomycetia bacterium]|nr:hypothetical protein [Planctomycetia bacterium]
MVILCGWNPYVTNTWNHTSPFYPLHTFDEAKHPKEDILARWYQRDDFREASPWQRFVYTYLITGQSSGFFIDTVEDISADIHDLDYFPFYSVNGNHRSFFLLLVFSLSLLFLMKKWEYWLVIGTVLLTIIIQPHSWWERFIPQIFALPVLILICVQNQITKEHPKLKVRWTMMTSVLLLLLLTNNSWGFFNRSMESVDALLLEAQEVKILQSTDLDEITCGTLGELESQSFIIPNKYNRYIHFYNQYYICHIGFEDRKVQCIKEISLKEQNVLITYMRTYIFAKKEEKPLPIDENICLKADFSELPKALKIVGEIRWRQFCQVWGGSEE